MQLTSILRSRPCRRGSKVRGRFHMDTLNKNLKMTLAKHFGKYESEVRINTFVDNLQLYISKQHQIVYKREDFLQIIHLFGLKRVERQCTKIELDQLIQSLNRFCLYGFFYLRSINYDLTFQKENVTFQEEYTDREISPTNAAAAIAAATLGAAQLTSTRSVIKNLSIRPTLNTQIVTEVEEIDNFIKNSLILNYYSTQNLVGFQKFQLISLARCLANQNTRLRNVVKGLQGSKFVRGYQNILNDYMENLYVNNARILKNLGIEKFVPYCLELNGVAGVGKSTFVDLLAQVLQAVLPFFKKEEMTYVRVNDKFWNGYKQQPIVLYDDSNQNEKMLFNLDNEIISIGSGQLVHPPMAFDKDTKFSSLFVVYTTNTPLIETTHADKGAISRRVHTVKVEPKSNLGSFTVDNFGEKWKYNSNVRPNPYNLTFDSFTANYIFEQFLQKLIPQISTTVSGDEFEDDFCDYSENIEEPFKVDQLLDYIDTIKREKAASFYYGQLVIDESYNSEMERKKRQEKLKSSRGSVAYKELPKSSVKMHELAKLVSTRNSSIINRRHSKSKLESLHLLLDEYHNRRGKTNFYVNTPNVALIVNDSILALIIEINGVKNYLYNNSLGNYEYKISKTSDIMSLLPMILTVLSCDGECSVYEHLLKRQFTNKKQFRVNGKEFFVDENGYSSD